MRPTRNGARPSGQPGGGAMKILAGPLGVACLLVGALLGDAALWAGDATDPHNDHQEAVTAAAAGAHAHHHLDASQRLRRSVVDYAVPAVTLVRDDGTPVSLRTELDDGRPVIMNFIYTTCTTICPLSSQVFEQFQTAIGRDRDTVHLVSISIDPEQDTPRRLKEYTAKFHAGPSWQHYTGTLEASVRVQRAYDVYRGDKMNHTAVTLLRPAHGQSWVRLDGFATAKDLLAEYRALAAAP